MVPNRVAHHISRVRYSINIYVIFTYIYIKQINAMTSIKEYLLQTKKAINKKSIRDLFNGVQSFKVFASRSILYI